MQSKFAATVGLAILLAAPAAMAQRAGSAGAVGGSGKGEVKQTGVRQMDVRQSDVRQMGGKGGEVRQSGGYVGYRSYRRSGSSARSCSLGVTRSGDYRSARFRFQRDSDRGDDPRGRGSDYERGYTAEDPLGDDGGEESSGAGDRLGGTGNGGGGILPR